MKRIKNNLIITMTTIVLILTTSIGQAQRVSRTPGQRPQSRDQQMPPIPDSAQIVRMVADLSTELSLTEDQIPMVSEAFFTHFDEVKALTNNGKRPDREAMEAVKKSFETEVEVILTKDQKKLFKDYMKKRQPKQRPPQQ